MSLDIGLEDVSGEYIGNGTWLGLDASELRGEGSAWQTGRQWEKVKQTIKVTDDR